MRGWAGESWSYRIKRKGAVLLEGIKLPLPLWNQTLLRPVVIFNIYCYYTHQQGPELLCTETDTHVHTSTASTHCVLAATQISHISIHLCSRISTTVFIFVVSITVSSLITTEFLHLKNVINHKYVNIFIPKVTCAYILNIFL